LVIRRLAAVVVLSAAIAATSNSQTLPVQQITTDALSEGWGQKGSPTSGVQILFYDGDDTVRLYNGTTNLTVQPTDAGNTINNGVWMLGSGSTAGHVIGGWRRGNGYSDVSVDGNTPVKVNVNPGKPRGAELLFSLSAAGHNRRNVQRYLGLRTRNRLTANREQKL
jgi:hypothetical protein